MIFTQVFHALREESFERVQTATLGVHSLGQRVAQMHLVLEEEPGSGRSRLLLLVAPGAARNGARTRRAPAAA